MAPCLLFFFFFFPFITISISSALSFTMKNECQVSTNYKKASAIFIFGDSFFDPGNNNYINTTTLDQANFWPYGQTYFNFPTGRFSDGRLVSDFIAEYAKLPLVPPYMQPGIEKQYYKGVNFASAGAGALTETFQGSVISLDTQLSDYKKVEARLRKDLNDVKAKDILSSAVYLISIGTNDYTSPFLTNSTVLAQYRRSKYVEMVIGNLTTVIKEIYAKGGRKFGLFNLGPLGCFPGLRMLNPRSNGGCFQEPCVIAKLHNKALSKLLTKMEKHLEGFKYSLYDFNSNLIGRMIHPSNYAEYANLPPIPPYLQPGNHQFEYGANFASSGAGSLPDTYSGLVISLRTQLSYLKNVKRQLVHKVGHEQAEQLLGDAVYLISIGSNDYLRPYVTNSSTSVFHLYSHGEYVDMVIGNLTTVIKEIHEEGGRKFGLLNVGPLSCSPYARVLNAENTGDCIEELAVLVNLHNTALSNILQQLGRELKGFIYSNFNYYAAATERMNHPFKYGFKEGKSACCGSGPFRGEISCGGKRGIKEYQLCPNASEYMLFDFVHPTEKANQQFAELMWGGGTSLVRPYNLKTLFEYAQEYTPSGPSVESIVTSLAPI